MDTIHPEQPTLPATRQGRKAKKARGIAEITPRRGSTIAQQQEPDTIRDRILRGAGLTPELLGERLRKAIDKATDKLEATETKYFSHEGVVTDEREVVSHMTQLKAVQEINNIIESIVPAKAALGASTGPVTINVNVPWGSTRTAPMIDVTQPHSIDDEAGRDDLGDSVPG